jgi:arylsulfatase A-like enzyme
VVKYEKKLHHIPHKKGTPYILEENPASPDPLSREALTSLLKDKRYQGFSYLPGRIVKIKQYQDNPQFAAMVESVDESLGRVLAKLKELKLDKNTIIIFFSDNGGMSAANFGRPTRQIARCDLNKAYSTSNLPLRGGKGWLYEGGIREPLVIYWPGSGHHGTVSDVPVISTDFYATILDMLGIQPDKHAQDGIDGMSLVPLLNEQKDGVQQIKDRALYWHWPNYSNHGEQSPGGAVRYGDYKLIEYYENGAVQLFNIKTDPGEQHDLTRSNPAKVNELRAMLHAWRKKVHAEMPVPNPNYDPKKIWPTPSTDKNEP